MENFEALCHKHSGFEWLQVLVRRVMRFSPILLIVFCWLSASVAWSGALDRMAPAPKDWHGHVFHPSFQFPKSFQKKGFPWLAISFRHKPEAYLHAVLAYALEGQDLEHWELAANKVRRWYHVPWMGPGATGREYVNGLTRGRDFSIGELSPAQVSCRQNWAIAFYNDVGGAMLREVWGDGRRDPSFKSLPFLLNTVAVKLVFTEADEVDDPLLVGAPRLQAAISDGPDRAETGCPAARASHGTVAHRSPTWLRLVQVDLAVREQRASYKTGWVFGSYRYDGTLNDGNPWRRLRPIGLMWGNDPQLTDDLAAKGDKPNQSIVMLSAPGGGTLGRAGRMNGLVDNRSSACSSCHMAAQWPSIAPMLAPDSWAEARCWFRNIDGRFPFGFMPGDHKGCGDATALGTIAPLDFSMQLAMGARNWALDKVARMGHAKTAVGTLQREADGALKVDGLVALPLK